MKQTLPNQDSLPVVQLSVTLSGYEWHLLLKELEQSMRFANLDTSVAIRLFDEIASQLAGVRVSVEKTNTKS